MALLLLGKSDMDCFQILEYIRPFILGIFESSSEANTLELRDMDKSMMITRGEGGRE